MNRPVSEPATLFLELLSQRVRIEAEDPAWLELVAGGFEESAVGAVSGDPDLTVELKATKGSSQAATWEVQVEPEGAFERRPRTPASLVSSLNLWAVNNTELHYVFHAGAVARHGVGVLLPATSFSGKSTLTAGLVKRGYDLFSDEVGAIDLASGRLDTYPRALSLRGDVLELLGLDSEAGVSLGDGKTRMVRAAALGGRRADGGVKPGLIVLPRFRAGEETQLERLRPGLAAMALLESSCSQQRLKEAGLDFVLDLARRLPCWRLTHSDLDQSVAAVDELVAGVVGS